METSDIKVTYVDHMGDDLRVVNAARVSVGKSSDELVEKDIKLIKFLADNQHMTPFEHNVLSVIVECPLYIRSQIHRHRTFAYNELSRRYTAENISFYMPKTIKHQGIGNKQISGKPHERSDDFLCDFKYLYELCDNWYDYMIKQDISREQARSILPQGLMTKFIMTGSLRNWVHFLKLRLDSHAQEEVQEVAEQVVAIILEKYPISGKVLLDA